MFKNISIKKRLTIFSTILLIGLALSISYLSIEKTKQTVIEYEMKKLSTVEVAKHREIKKYLKSLKNLLVSMSMDISTKNAMESFNYGFSNLSKDIKIDIDNIRENLILDYESNYISNVKYDVPHCKKKRLISEYIPKNINAMIAQYIFISQNPAPTGKKNIFVYDKHYNSLYVKAHREYHTSFNSYLKSFNLYDIFLINTNGDIVYSDFKEKDFATNLKNGVYSNTGLAKAYKKALLLKNGEIAFEDFTPYEPSYNNYTSFLATPIFKNGKKIGVIAFQMPVEQLTKIMQFDGKYKMAGLGKTGESYLVGEDYMMRTNSRFVKDIDDRIVQELGSTVGIFKIKTKSSEYALSPQRTENSESKRWIIKDYRGIDVLSVCHTIDIYGQAKWAVIAEIDKKEAMLPVGELIKNLITTISFLLILFVFASLYFVNKMVAQPLNKFQNDLLHFFEFLKGKEKTVKELDASSNDEIGKMAKSINDGIVITKKLFEIREIDSWIKDGINKLNVELIKENSMKEVAYNAIHFISTYLNAGAGVIFIYDEEDEKLKEYSSYAHVKRDSLSNSYALGEGVVGQVALQHSPIELKNCDKSHTKIQTAVIDAIPLNTYTYPLLYQDKLIGVIEIASNKFFEKKEIEFLNSSSMVISTAISTAIQNLKVEKLLLNTKEANLRLQENQKQLEEANASMEEQQQQLEIANANMEEQQQQLEEVNASMEEQQQQLQISEQNLKIQNESLMKAKHEIESKAKEIELSSRYKSEFLANMSHELRTPLNAIILLSQLLEKNKNKNLLEDDIKKAKTIFKSGNELLRLINDILDLSKVESGKMEVIVDSFDSKEFLENIENLFESSAIEKNLEFHVIDNYKGIIHSDMDRISQIVRNLISNALKFTKDGSITLEINKVDDSDKPIEIVVSDTGIGIPKEKQEQIFKAFTQADGSTSREYGGTGLGLSISKELVSLLGGDIKLESEDGKGSKFIVRLSDLEKDIDKSEDIEVFEDDRNSLIDEEVILIIDDNISFTESISKYIHENGYKCLIAHTAKDGLSLIKEYAISAILLDLTLPDINGMDILREIKTEPSTKDIPVYIISSKDKDEIDDVMSDLKNFILEYKIIDEDDNEAVEEISQNIDLSGLNVLIVDDDIKNIFVLDSALSEANANVVSAYNGKEALEKLKEDNSIDIVLMDIMMPVMNGYEAIEEIRSDETLANLPIIAVTAKAMKEDKEKCIRIGANDFISKPIDVDILMKLVKVWSDKKHR